MKKISRQPTARFELATPCLRNRCTNHCAMLAYDVLCMYLSTRDKIFYAAHLSHCSLSVITHLSLLCSDPAHLSHCPLSVAYAVIPLSESRAFIPFGRPWAVIPFVHPWSVIHLLGTRLFRVVHSFDLHPCDIILCDVVMCLMFVLTVVSHWSCYAGHIGAVG